MPTDFDPVGPRKSRALKYAVIGIGYLLAFALKFPDMATPTVLAAIFCICVVSGGAAWTIEFRKKVNLGWLFSLVLYTLCLGVICVIFVVVVTKLR